MNKIFKLLALLVLIHISKLEAQTPNPLRIGFGISNGIPTENPYGYSLGGDIKLQKDISAHLSATFSVGFNHYFETKKIDLSVPSASPYPDAAPWNAIPIKAGLKVFPAKHLYLAAEAGVGLFTEVGKPSFIWSPSVGVALSNGLDLSVKYEAFNRYKALNQVALRVAYGVDIRKIRFNPKTTENGSWELNASLNPGIGLSDSRFVIGTDLQLERYLSGKFAFTFSGGFTHFSNKPVIYNYTYAAGLPPALYKINTDMNLIPVQLGVKVFPVNRFYLAAAAGIGVDINGNSSFVVSATAGVKLGSRFDLGIKYENYTDFYRANQLSLRLGYRIF